MQRHVSAAASAAAGLVIALASAVPANAAGPVTWKQSYYFKVFGSAGDTMADRASFEQSNQAFPAASVGAAQLLGGSQAFANIAQAGFVSDTRWRSVGPTVGNVPGPVTYTGRATVNSGRVAALAIAPGCSESACTVLVGAAGGGVWKSTNALASTPSWREVNEGLPTTSVGSLIYDPSDRSGRTVYLGTGEPNGSSDSEAGLGLFRSTDGGEHWSLVAGSYAVAHDRAIGAVAVDPRNARHIWIGTAVARHGLASTYGGRFTPPGAPKVGLYESTDGGASFTLAFSQTSDTPVPNTTGGNDYFRGGVNAIKTYRRGDDEDAPTQIYFAMFDYGLFRSTGKGGYELVFASAGGGSPAGSLDSRTEFALAPMGKALRIYVGDTGTKPADFFRTDDANVPAAALVTGGTNGGWIKLSDPTPGNPGYSSYNFCEGQCSYDMFVASPPGRPDVVWIGGSMNYGEIFTPMPPSNGRAVMRSTDAGVSFTDMTNDTQGPAPLGMHPDQHAIAFVGSSDVAIIGSDGGVVRTSGQFADASAQCGLRGTAARI